MLNHLDCLSVSTYVSFFRHFLQQALQRAKDCRKAYYLYTQQGAECEVSVKVLPLIWTNLLNLLLSQISCSDVVLFWRIQQVIKITGNALRQQVINRESAAAGQGDQSGAGRVQRWRGEEGLPAHRQTRATSRGAKWVLCLIEFGANLIAFNSTVKVRQIQEKLEEFINSLNQEK